jgi:hypothetical protein
VVARDGHRGGLLFVVHGHHLSLAGWLRPESAHSATRGPA